ncbi:MAG: substrate-binding domain-containing protein [Christensenella sp.]
MTKKNYYIIISLILACIFIVLGVFVYQTNAISGSIDVTLIVKSQQQGFEFWELLKKGAQEGAKEFNVKLSVDGAMSEVDVAGQIKVMEQAIAKKPDAIILAAADSEALLPYAKQAKEQGIKLILVDSALEEKAEDCFVGTNNYEAANSVGNAMAHRMGDVGKIAVISHATQTATAQQRFAGFERAVRNYPDIEIVGTYDIGDSTEKSYETTLNVLRENPDITGIYATNQISAEGVTLALKELKKDVTFFAFDSSIVQNEALENDIVDGFAVQMPFNMGYLAVTSAVDACAGKLRKTDVDTGFAFATKENMRQEAIQKLIYPFV